MVKRVFKFIGLGALMLSSLGVNLSVNAQEKTEIEITWRGTGDVDNVRKYLQSFEEYYEAENEDVDIVLSPVMASESDYFSKLALMMQSEETAPDIVFEDTFILNADANAGYLLNLDDYVNEWDDWSNYTEALKSGTMGEDGSTYAIPATTDSRGLWYNREVFKQAGLPEDWQPKNWDEIIQAAETIKEKLPDVVPFSMNVAKVNGESVSMQTFEMLLYATGETLYNDEGKWNVNGEGLLESFKFVDDIMNQKQVGPSLSIALNTSYGSTIMQDFLPNGKAGISLDGSWNIGNYTKGNVAELEDPEATLGFALFPTNDGQEPGFATMAGGWSLAIPAKSNNHDLTWEVLKAMGSKEWQTKRAIVEGTLTVRDDSAQDEEYLQKPFINVITQALENAHFRPKNDLYPNVSIVIQETVEAVATGALTPEQAVEQYKASVTEIVGEENTY